MISIRIYKYTPCGVYLEDVGIMIKVIGFLMRFPFFLLGIILWSIVSIPLWVLRVLIEGLELSLSFFHYAWADKREEWEVEVNIFKENLGIRFFINPYYDLFRWLLGS